MFDLELADAQAPHLEFLDAQRLHNGALDRKATDRQRCTLFHTEAAKLNGATDAEVEEAAHYGTSTGSRLTTTSFVTR